MKIPKITNAKKVKESVVIPSFEEGSPAPINKVTLPTELGAGRGGRICNWRLDLPRRADALAVALLLLNRRGNPSSKEGITMLTFRQLVAFASILLLISPLLAQDQKTQFTLKVTTQLVVQTVSVTDKDGKPIEGLTKDDFIVSEDNVPQTVSVFEFERLDDSAAPKPITIRADRNPIPFSALPAQNRIAPEPSGERRYQDRRLLVLYFDMSNMGDADRFRALGAAQTFIGTQMKGPDLVAIITYSDGAVRVRQDFTDNRGALEEIIYALLNGADQDDTSSDFGQDAGEFNIFNTDRQLAALQTTVSMLGILNEKKSLVYFASGMRLNGVDNQAQLRATLNAARRANVAFYPVDSRGLVAMAPMGDASRPSPGGIGMYTGATAMATMRVFQRSQDALYTLAADTGGKALLDYNDLSLGIVRAQQATSSYYILGYYSTNGNRDGRLRRVKISLKNRPAELSYREAYYAEKEFSKFTTADKERQLEEALLLGDPITDLTIAMELNYFQLNSAEYFVPLAVKIPGSELVLAQKAGAERTQVDFIGEIKDEFGTTITNIRDKWEAKLKGETATLLARSPIQYDAGYTLLPGKYIIKFLARNAETGRIGTYQTEFIVPNLNKELVRLPISSVVLSGQRVAMEDALFTAGKNKAAREQAANPLIESGQKLLPSVTRVFSKSRDMYVYLQAYERAAETMRPVGAFVAFLKGNEKVFETPPYIVTTGMDPKSKAVPLELAVPLGSVPEGEYICQISVIEPGGQKAAFWEGPVKIVP
jgi:VWFA-related protein